MRPQTVVPKNVRPQTVLNLQYDWEQMQKMQSVLPDNLKWDDTVSAKLHQNTAPNEDNIKYVSACGHFEIIYDVNHNVVNPGNAPLDMGTFNYYSPNNWSKHYAYDIYPYKSFGWFGWGYGNVPN